MQVQCQSLDIAKKKKVAYSPIREEVQSDIPEFVSTMQNLVQIWRRILKILRKCSDKNLILLLAKQLPLKLMSAKRRIPNTRTYSVGRIEEAKNIYILHFSVFNGLREVFCNSFSVSNMTFGCEFSCFTNLVYFKFCSLHCLYVVACPQATLKKVGNISQHVNRNKNTSRKN